ncbi:hypothetical protein BRARA_E02514 [Brassica rapa]|uniref:Uncharacterized protein n=1 Tax=Brassica campestris TaxID=3711 RepID=A0A397ZM02_BRACM|nr:hypothetical protein BRARA_E02514 [Brassica rapa]
MLGAQHALDPLTTVKACVNNAGIALIQHGWHPKSFITISREINSRAIEKSSKLTGVRILRQFAVNQWYSDETLEKIIINVPVVERLVEMLK